MDTVVVALICLLGRGPGVYQEVPKQFCLKQQEAGAPLDIAAQLSWADTTENHFAIWPAHKQRNGNGVQQ